MRDFVLKEDSCWLLKVRPWQHRSKWMDEAVGLLLLLLLTRRRTMMRSEQCGTRTKTSVLSEPWFTTEMYYWGKQFSKRRRRRRRRREREKSCCCCCWRRKMVWCGCARDVAEVRRSGDESCESGGGVKRGAAVRHKNCFNLRIRGSSPTVSLQFLLQSRNQRSSFFDHLEVELLVQALGHLQVSRCNRIPS